MFRLTDDELNVIALFVEGFLYGLYSGIFALYLQYQLEASKKDTDKAQNLIFYFICALYVLSMAVFVCDITVPTYQLLGKALDSFFPTLFIQATSFGCCDFIAQSILIYRCWIVWGRDTRVVVIPSILTLVFLAAWLAGSNSLYKLSGQIVTPVWGRPVFLTSLVLSLTVNALVTGLIVLRIFKVFREVKTTSDDQILGATGGNKLRHIIFIIIESGMTLFSIQLARLVVTIVGTEAAYRPFVFIGPIHEMLNGITPTIILVRTAMGLSFHDEKSMEEAAIGSLRFASNHPNSVQETGGINIVNQDSREDDIGIQQSSDIDIVVKI